MSNSDWPFLEVEHLERLTGRSQKSKQIEWLRAKGIPFHVNATGHPVVLWTAIDAGTLAAPKEDSRAWKPAVLLQATAGKT